jgi:hypothetical protein
MDRAQILPRGVIRVLVLRRGRRRSVLTECPLPGDRLGQTHHLS